MDAAAPAQKLAAEIAARERATVLQAGTYRPSEMTD
jgi:hypothetical protein